MSKQSESPVSVHIEKVEGLQGAAEEFVRLVRGSTKFSGVMPMVVENGLCIALTGTGPLGTENAHRIAAALNGSQAGFDIGPVADGHTANHPYAVDPRVAFRQGACWAQALLAAPSAPGAQPEPPRSPLDDPKLQELFSATIDGAMASGFQGVAPAPEGHWLAPWWERGREYAAPSQREAGRELTDDEIDSTLDNAYSAAVKSGKTNGGMVGHLWNHIAARAVIAADRAARGEAGRAIPREPAPELWRHVKTGGVYRWLMSAVKEEDRSILVIYQSEETGVRWVRPSKAFYDGRFVRVTSPTEAPKETPEQFRERMLSHGRELDEAAKTDPLHGAGQKEGGE